MLYHIFSILSTISFAGVSIDCATSSSFCLVTQLADIGLELTFSLHTLLLRDVEKWIRDGRDKMVEAVKLRAQEDTWKTLHYENRDKLNKFIQDMREIGVANVESYVMGELAWLLSQWMNMVVL